MRKRKKRLIAGVVAFSIFLGGCGKVQQEAGEEKAAMEATGREEKIKTEIVSGKEEKPEKDVSDFFPDFYQAETEKVKFDCALEISEEFKAFEFHIPMVRGIYNYNQDAAREEFVDMERVTEQYEYPPTEQTPVTEHFYLYEDGTGIYLSLAMTYYSGLAGKYRYVVRNDEKGAPREKFSFATGEECVTKVKEALQKIDYPEDEFKFDWFSTSGEEYAEMEQQAIEDGAVEAENINQEGWSKKDNSYEIYAWQIYEGLPVFPWVMTSQMTRAIENYQKAPVSALFTEKGMLALSAQAPYIFEKTEETAVFKSFSEIVDAVSMKYENLLDENKYFVTRAKLVLRVYYNENQELTAEPVWYFEVVDSNSNMEVVLIQALTGEEIYLA